jgi:hypothetical protein
MNGIRNNYSEFLIEGRIPDPDPQHWNSDQDYKGLYNLNYSKLIFLRQIF